MRRKRSRAAAPVGFVLSVSLHLAAIAAAVTFAHRAPAQPQPELVDVELVPPKGVVEGQVNGTGAVRRTASRTDDAPRARSAPHSAATPEQKDAIPTDEEDAFYKRTHARDAKDAKHDDKKKDDDKLDDKEREALRDAVKKAMLAPETQAADGQDGNGTAAKGTPDGKAGGKKSGISARYAGMLDGWFSGRFRVSGTNLTWDELKTLSVVATIQISPHRQVTGFSMGSSGNGTYDAAVRATLQGSVGQTLPAPPDEDPVPPSITLRFRCRSQDRCS